MFNHAALQLTGNVTVYCKLKSNIIHQMSLDYLTVPYSPNLTTAWISI